MAIYSGFGEKVVPVRLATLEDVKKFEGRKPDKQDRERTKEGWRAVFKYVQPDADEQGRRSRHPGEECIDKEFLADAAFLRADGGFAEIHDAFKALGGGVQDE